MRAGTLFALLILSIALASAAPAGASFPGRNGKLAVTVECYNDTHDGAVSYIRAISPGGSDLGKLTPCGDGTYAPAFSPRGTRLAFLHQSPFAGEQRFGLADSDGTNWTVIPVQAGDLYEGPSFSPSGTRIAFSRNGQIWTSKLDGSGQRRVRKPPCANCLIFLDPKWSPRGGKIVFRAAGSGRKGFRSGLYVMNARTGKGLRRVAKGGASEADWAPNGKRIVYTTEWFGPDGDTVGGGDLRTVRPSGKGRRLLLRTAKVAAVAPAWAPNGKSVAFVSLAFRDTNDGGATITSSVLRRVPAKGGKSRRIRKLEPPAVEEDGFVSPDLAWQSLP